MLYKRQISNGVKKTEEGFIALTSVLIIGAIVLVLGISLFHSALTDYSISTAYESGQEAAFLADFCLKEGVLKLKENINYKGGEEININNATCSINFVKQINENTKEISSLGRAGDQPHFSRSSRLVRYIIESTAEDWENPEAQFGGDELEIVGDSLKLKRFEEKIILNSATGESCDTLCQQENDYQCIGVGTDPAASDGSMWTALENGEYSCLWVEEGADCENIMWNYSQELPDCDGQAPAWMRCRCEHGEIEGYRISPEFNISGEEGETVKDSRIFWQANERFDGTINVKVNVFAGGEWSYEQEVVNGASIPGLNPGTSLSGVKIKTKTSFVGGPDFYPSLENIKIFLDLE